jgi:hypothetical protein
MWRIVAEWNSPTEVGPHDANAAGPNRQTRIIADLRNALILKRA